jgi:nitronate monooxygenase
MSLQHLVGIRLPVVQAPMAGVQGARLAAAVSNAGGLGSIPCALLSVEALRAELEAMRAQTDAPFNVNFFSHSLPAADPGAEQAWLEKLTPYYREHSLEPDQISVGAGRLPFSAEAAAVLAEYEPAVVSFHFGLPSEELLEAVRRWGAKILSSATTVEEARWLEARGVDAIIAQGLEAGGHRGHFLHEDLTLQMGTLALVPQIVQAVKVPVIAAGGIAEARGAAAAMALGAAAVQVGTAYLLCPECDTPPLYRAALASEAAAHTALTNVFTGRPARAIVNRAVRELGPLNPQAPEFPRAASYMMPLRARAEAQGRDDFSSMWSGQNASGCRAQPAAELTRELGEAADKARLAV